VIVDWKKYANWEAVYDDLPVSIQELLCSPECLPNIRVADFDFDRNRGGLLVHKACGKPTVFSAFRYLEFCYECERLYLPYVVPDKFLLCERCGGDKYPT
jgi:hypothetical protein